jgi:hypothetical protein
MLKNDNFDSIVFLVALVSGAKAKSSERLRPARLYLGVEALVARVQALMS